MSATSLQGDRHAIRIGNISPSGKVEARVRRLIERVVAETFGIERAALRGRSRGRARVAFARQVAMYLAHIACGMSLTDVGRVFERDRTTVAYACEVVEDRRDEQNFDRVLDLLENILCELVSSILRSGRWA